MVGYISNRKHSTEYCRRVIALLSQFRSEDIVKYEDFVDSPFDTMRRISALLELPFDESFEDIFPIFKVTGDSGRSSNAIGRRDRDVPEELLRESEESSAYERILQSCSYNDERDKV